MPIPTATSRPASTALGTYWTRPDRPRSTAARNRPWITPERRIFPPAFTLTTVRIVAPAPGMPPIRPADDVSQRPGRGVRDCCRAVFASGCRRPAPSATSRSLPARRAASATSDHRRQLPQIERWHYQARQPGRYLADQRNIELQQRMPSPSAPLARPARHGTALVIRGRMKTIATVEADRATRAPFDVAAPADAAAGAIDSGSEDGGDTPSIGNKLLDDDDHSDAAHEPGDDGVGNEADVDAEPPDRARRAGRDRQGQRLPRARARFTCAGRKRMRIATAAATTRVIGPVGPVICTGVPPSNAATMPVAIAP